MAVSTMAAAQTPRVLDVGDSWAFFPYALQSPPALEEVLALPEFNLGQYLEDGSIGLTNIFAEGWDSPEQKELIHERLVALPTLDICHVSLGGNDFVHGWKRQMTEEQKDALFDEVIDHIRNVVQFCLDERPDIRVAIVGYDYINLFDGFDINAFDEVYDYESITHWAITYWGFPIPETKQQVLDTIVEVHEVWIEMEARKLALAQEFGERVTYIHNFGYVQHVFGVPNAGVAPGDVSIPDGPDAGYANFPNGRNDLYNPRSVMKIDDGEMDPLHLNPEGFIAYYSNIVRQTYAAWLSDSTPPEVTDIRPVAAAMNPTDATQVVFEVRFTEAVTGVDATDFHVRTTGSLTGAQIAGITVSGNSRMVTIDGFTGTGTIALDLIDDDTIYDHVWYPLRRLKDGGFTCIKPFWIGGGLLGCGFFADIGTQGEALYTNTLAETWETADLDGNNIPDRFELALLARLVCDTGYGENAALQSAFNANRSALESEAGFSGFETEADAVAALCTISEVLRDAIVAALSLTGSYTPFMVSTIMPLAGNGDADGDELSNLIEYDWIAGLGLGTVEYAIAASTAGLGPSDIPACADITLFDTQAEAFWPAISSGAVEWEHADWGENGIPDEYEIALLASVFCNGSHPLHDALSIAYMDNLDALEADFAAGPFADYHEYLALAAAGDQDVADQMITDLVLAGPLSSVNIAGEEPFTANADLDDDGATNNREYVWAFIRGGTPQDYAEEASDPAQSPGAAIPNCDYATTFENQGADLYDLAFQIGAWEIADADVSMIVDRYEIAVLAALLCDPVHPLHESVTATYETNLETLEAEGNAQLFSPVFEIMAALATMSDTFATLLEEGFELQGDLVTFETSGEFPLSPLGDIDMDNVINYDEYVNIGQTAAIEPEYVRAVLGAYYPPAPVLTIHLLSTNDPMPGVTGTVRYATSLELSFDGVDWEPVAVDDNNWYYPVNDPLADGVYDIRVRAVGAYGSEGQDGTTNELTIDTVAPEITLTGEARLVTEAAQPYIDPGATASDDREGDITGKLVIRNSVDTSFIDTFAVTYNVSDAAGNPAPTVSRIVDVRDSTPPVLTLLGGSEVDTDALHPFVDPGVQALDSYSGDISENVVVSGEVDTSMIGTYELTYNVRDEYANDAEPVSRLVHVIDQSPPVVTLLGANPILVDAFGVYNEPGATAEDLVEGDVSESIVVSGEINFAEPGSYELAYTAADSTGNESAPLIRTVIVVDNGDPVITILGDNPLNHKAGEPYEDPGATAFDAVDGDITEDMLTFIEVDVDLLGEYSVTYVVQDAAGNGAQVSRTVNVVDSTPPEITLLGETTITAECGEEFEDPGVTALDNRDGDLTDEIVADNQVDIHTLGTYSIFYDVSDSDENAADQKVRTVIIQDTTRPVITVTGDTALNLTCGDTYTEEGATALDNCDGDISGQIVVTGNVDTYTTGTYFIFYNVKDSRNLPANERIRVVVVQGECPVEGEECPVGPFHTADQDESGSIGLNELLRLIQFFNSASFGCEPGTEDGFAPNDPDQDCCPHDTDYNGGPSWRVDLTELLRMIQFFNSGGYHFCPDDGTEDGFCPGVL